MGNSKERSTEDVTLIDFLYRDTSIIDSFYAQLFGANLKSVQKVLEETQESKHSIEGSIKLVKGLRESRESHKNQIQNNLDPHDSKIIDLFNVLSIPVLNKPISQCQNGEIILVRSKITIRNLEIIKSTIPLFESLGVLNDFKMDESTVKNLPSKHRIRTLGELIKKIIDLMPNSLEAEVTTPLDERAICPLKDEYLSYKSQDLLNIYGPHIPGDWYIIGIVSKLIIEEYNPNFTPKNMNQAIDYLHSLLRNLANEDRPNYSITPIVIYRELIVKEQNCE